MFGFLAKYKKAAKEVGTVVEQTIRIPFISTTHWASAEYEFSPPTDLYKDPYVLGFCYSLGSLFFKYEFNHLNTSTTKSGEFLLEYLRFLSRNIAGFDLAQYIDENMKNIFESTKFKKGLTDSQTLIGVTYDLLKKDDNDPVFIKAKELIATGHFKELNRTLNHTITNDKEELIQALYELTIIGYIRNKYPKN